jgi:protein archease
MNALSCGYFDHDADIGVVGRGETVERCMEAAAAATFAIMADLSRIEPKEQVRVEFTEADYDFALVAWLNGLLAAAREHGLALSRFRIEREADHWHGEAWGAPWQPGADRGTEVKGATLTMLSVKQMGDGWEARCVVDV